MMPLMVSLGAKEKEILIAEIKDKRELRGVADEFVVKLIEELSVQEPKLFLKLKDNFHTRSAVFKEVLKKVRAKLRRSYGLFRTEEKVSDVEELMRKYFASKAAAQSELLREILQSNASTRERLSFYSSLYSKLFKITGKPESILDLGCALNPFSIPLMGLRKLKYYAYDLSDEEVKLLDDFFENYGKSHKEFIGKTGVINLLDFKQVEKLPNADVCFLWKVSDVLDQNKGHKNTEEVLKAIPARFVVVSFSTLTMSGKKMTAPRRRWMEWLCNRLGYLYNVLEFENEMFYVVKK